MTKNTIPLKSGEIFRTNYGEFSFVCTYCETICKTGEEIIDHINSHFDKENSFFKENFELFEPPLPLPEFVAINEVKQEQMETGITSSDGNIVEVKIEPTDEPSVFKTLLNKSTKTVDTSMSSPTTKLVRIFKRTTRRDNSNPNTEVCLSNSADNLKSSPRKIVKFAERPTTEGMTDSTDKSISSPTTKIVRIVKLKRIKPNPRLMATKKKVLTNVGMTSGTVNHDNIETPTGTTIGLVVEESNPHPNPNPHPTKNIDNNYHRRPKRSSCYQCEMVPRIYDPTDHRKHVCLFCPISFPNHIEFQRHVVEVHKKNPDIVMCQEFYCYVCEKKFPFRQYLTEHLKKHINEDPTFLCPTCGSSHKSMKHLMEHEKIHVDRGGTLKRHINEDPIFLCPTCGSIHRTLTRLMEHEKKHEESGRVYKCDECKKEFKRFVLLRRHLWCHNTNLSFVCKVCQKAFKMKRYLDRHMAVHDVPKIPCRHCDATFRFVSVRRAHEQSRHQVV